MTSITETNLDTLLAQRAELDSQIASMQAEAQKEAIAKARSFVAKHNLKPEDVFPASRKAVSAKSVPVKYRDENGNTWTGRGLKPRWLHDALASGATLDSFKVDAL